MRGLLCGAKSFSVTLAFVGLAMGPCQRVVWGQPIGDNTVNTQVNVDGNFFDITGGQQAGPNLFHSFEAFNIPAGRTAQFLPAATVEAIFGRVTGAAPSLIGGRIEVLGDANLFLLNPQGFVFEAGSSLSLNGNFTLATAESIRFANGDRFFASFAQPSLLSISAPVGLGNIVANGAIENRGSLINNGGDIAFAAEQIGGTGDLRSAGSIQLTSQGSIAQDNLIASSISAEAQGNVSFRALTAPLSVSLAAGQDLRIAQGIKTLGNSADGGSVVLKAGGAIAVDGRIDSRSTASIGNAGPVDIQAGEDLRLTEIQAFVGPSTRGNSGNVTLESGGTLEIVNGAISTFNGVNGAGNGGDIRLEARDILLSGTRLQSSNLGDGNGGNIELQAQNKIQLRSSPTNLARVLSLSNVDSRGDSGNILLQAGQIELVDALLDSRMRGVGRAGDITLRATNPVPLGQGNQIMLAGDRAKSELTSRLTGQGLAGDIRLESPTLRLNDNARISSVTEAQGDAGSIAIQARTLALEGNSLIETGNNRRTARGSGGDLSIETAQLSLRTGARLQSSVEGQGDGGDIRIEASEFITIDGANPSGPAALIKASIATSGQGQAGRIEIKGGDIALSNGAQIQSNGENSGARPGQIEIVAQTLLLADGGRLSADIRNSARGDGGTVNITAERISATGNSDITALSRGGDLGLISLKTNLVEGLQLRDRLTPENDLLGTVTIEKLPEMPIIPVLPPEIPTGEPPEPESPNPELPNPGSPNPEPPNPQLPNSESPNSPEPVGPSESTVPGETHDNPAPLPPVPVNPSQRPRPNPKPGPFSGIVLLPDPSASIVIPDEALAPVLAAIRPQKPEAQGESSPTSQLQLEVITGNNAGLADTQFLGCRRDSDVMLLLSGRGGLANSSQHVLPGRSLWRDRRGTAWSMAVAGTNVIDESTQGAGQPLLQEATTWQLNGDRQIQLLADQNQALLSKQGSCKALLSSPQT